jgi:GntR family transcriptional regulator
LPSIRALSAKLGIHHNTCLTAYKELAEVGLIDVRHGSGARVKVLEIDAQPTLKHSSSLRTLAEFFIRETRHLGYDWADVQNVLSEIQRNLSTEGQRPLVMVDLHPDILPVFQAELEKTLEQPVRTVPLDNLNAQAECHSHFIVNRYHFQALKERLKAVIPHEEQLLQQITVIDVGSGQQELKLIHQVPVGKMIAVVSASTSILRQAEAVIRALRGDDIFVRTFLFGEEPLVEAKQLTQRAQVVFADWSCLPIVQTFTKKPLQPIQTIPQHELDKLKALLKA